MVSPGCGSMANFMRALALGFYLGVDCPVTYPNADSLRALVAQVPLDRLLLETDCPYLAPQARRGRRNEPGYLPYNGEQVAELQGVGAASLGVLYVTLIGDLFTETVDRVWGPIEAMRGGAAPPIPAWDADLSGELLALLELPRRQAGADAGDGHGAITQSELGRLGQHGAVEPSGKRNRAALEALQKFQ